ncbi:MAG: sensor histidine kinase [Bacteroidota bacterium]
MQSLNSSSIFGRNYNIVFNIVLWFLYYAILVVIFSQGEVPKKVDYVYALSYLFFMLVPIVISTYILLPKLLQRRKYIVFGITFLGICVLFGQLYTWYFDHWIDTIFSDYYFISYQTKIQAITKLIVFLIVSVLLNIFVSWLQYNEQRNRVLQLENQRIQWQLSHLRSQINPHFLFNSLNVIYALAIEKKEEIQEAIVQLSDVLRYIIYDADTEQIALKDEIKLLKNYIAFQKFRTHGLEEVSFETNVVDDSFTIYPMLFLPLLENAYKHGMTSNEAKTAIHITLLQEGTQCTFRIENSAIHSSEMKSENYSGVGLENIKNNLEIVYPNQHQFLIEKMANTFTVTIVISQKSKK